MKKFLLILTFLFTVNFSSAKTYIIPQGTVIQVYPTEMISTMLNYEGDEVVFLNPTDLWIEEFKAIPKNTKFFGKISFLRVPIQGINGALSFEVDTMELPTGEIVQIEGFVQKNGQNVIGGDLAPVKSYNYTIHTQKPIGWFGGMQGVLQYVPSGEYEFGIHTNIGPKDILFIILNSDIEFNI